jgi:hypothetical protein
MVSGKRGAAAASRAAEAAQFGSFSPPPGIERPLSSHQWAEFRLRQRRSSLRLTLIKVMLGNQKGSARAAFEDLLRRTKTDTSSKEQSPPS